MQQHKALLVCGQETAMLLLSTHQCLIQLNSLWSLCLLGSFFVYITDNVRTQISIISNDTCAEILQPHKTGAGAGAN